MDFKWTSASDSKMDIYALWSRKLQQTAEHILWGYFRTLPIVPRVEVSPHLNRVWGLFDPVSQTILLSDRLLKNYPWTATLQILKHELAHAICAKKKLVDPTPHGPHFRNYCHKLGVLHWASYSHEDLKELPQFSQLSEQGNAEDQKLWEKIQKLLALAESDNEHEASLAMNRVRELMLKAQYTASSRPNPEEDYYELVIEYPSNRIPSADKYMLGLVSDYYFVDYVLGHTYLPNQHKDVAAVYLLGTLKNLKLAEYVFAFLKLKIPSLWEAYKKANGIKGLKLKNSYIYGVIAGFRDKLAHEAAQTKAKAYSYAEAQGLVASKAQAEALVAEQYKELQAFKRRLHPRLISISNGGSKLDQATYSAGHQEGKKLSVNLAITHKSKDSRALLT